MVERRTLGQRRDELAEDDVDPGVGPGQEVLGDETGQRQDVGEGRPVAEPLEVGLHRDPRPAHRVAPLAADRDHGHVAAVLGDLLGGEPDGVRIEGAGQTAIARDQHDQSLALLASSEERVLVRPEHGGEVGDELVDLPAVRPGRQCRVLGALQL